MGTSGHVLHTRTPLEAIGEATGVPCALLASNRKWISFIPIARADIDAIAAKAHADVVDLWFDDDSGVVLRVHGPSGFLGELSFPFHEDRSGPTVEDTRFLEVLVRRGILTERAAEKLAGHLQSVSGKRERWIQQHGVERVFGFAFVEPIPDGATFEQVLELAPDATLSAPRGGRAERQGQSKRKRAATESEVSRSRPPAGRRTWSPQERSIVNLHIRYWSCVFSMNNWTLYKLYKKHLPAPDRREVDALGNAVLLGNDEEIRDRVERILAKIWAATNWDDVIRSPKLDDPGTDPEEASRWRKLTGRPA
jgi:hypothetical protein